jgi:hypothetical protein
MPPHIFAGNESQLLLSVLSVVSVVKRSWTSYAQFLHANFEFANDSFPAQALSVGSLRSL